MTAAGLPDLLSGAVRAVIFDLDGVITDTASVHARAWTRLFDEELARRAEATGAEVVPFTHHDYLTYVDGRPRYDGVRSFLRSRNIELPEGTPEDSPEDETVCGLGNRKNQLFREALAAEGAEVFPTSIELVERLREAGLVTGCVSSSRNCRLVLQSVGLLDHFDAIVDGTDAAALGLPGKPAPDLFVECARQLGTVPAQAVIVEDATSGVAAGAAGGFGHVIGVDRGAGHDSLLASGATAVVDDLGELLPADEP